MRTALFTSEIEECFSDDYLRERGRALASTGELKRIVPQHAGFSAKLLCADGELDVTVTIEGHDRPGACTCEMHEEEGLCPHIWAVAILLNDARKVNDLPVRKSLEARSLKRLSALRGKIQRKAKTAWDLAESDSSQLVFVIDLEECDQLHHLKLFVQQRSLTVRGSWGTSRPLDLAYFDFEDLQSEEDRHWLGRLGYGPDRFGGNARHWQLGEDEHRLSAFQAGELLPGMARSGRLHLRGLKASGELTEVGWDDGEPYAIRLIGELSPPDEPPLLFVNGALVRGDEERPDDEIHAILPGGLAVLGDQLVSIGPEQATPLLADLVREGQIAVGEAAIDEFRRLMGAMPAGVWNATDGTDETHGAPDGASQDGDPPIDGPTPELRIQVSSAGGKRGTRLECDILFEYGPGMRVAPDSRVITMKCPETGEMAQRKLDAEAARLAEYLEAGGRRTQKHRELGQDGSIATPQFSTVVRELLDRGWRVLADKRTIRRPGASSISVKSGMDWFDVSGGLQFGTETVSFPELLKAAKSGRLDVELGDGSTGMIPENWLETWGLLEIGTTEGDAIRFQQNQGWLLDALLAERALETSDADFDQYRKRLATFKRIKPVKEPASFQGELRPYQRDALGWFRFLGTMGLGGCLADDMGLGKTVQVLAHLEARRTRKLKKGEVRHPSIVVAPRSLVFNWIEEAKRFAPKLKVLDYTGTGRQARLAAEDRVDLLVTTYGSLRRDAQDLAETQFDHVILDEATAIKNAHSQSAKAARLLRSDHRLALTGTPVENHLHELWSLFEFLNPGMLGRSSAFREFAERGSGASDVSDIGRAIRPFFLRRTKTEVLTELPAKSEQVLSVELSKKDRKRYDELKQHFRQELLGPKEDEQGFQLDKLNVLTALLRLRQAACHPGLIDDELGEEDSAKLELLLPRLEELAAEGHKVLVFSQFTSFLGIVKRRLEALQIPFEYLDGKTRKRQERVERFQSDPDTPVFLISLKAGGHGLNLTASDYVFILDPWWNPAVEAQAIDRAHRMGQTRSVFAYRLIAKDTVEERVMELQEKKRELADQLFQGGKGVLKSLTRDDLDALLS